jgi:hypothetical protein
LLSNSDPDGKCPLYAPVLLSAIWDPPLAAKYFNLIPSFRIFISLIPGRQTPHNLHRHNYPVRDEAVEEEQLYEFTDQIHKLVSRLQVMGRRINRLEVMVWFNDDRDRERDFGTARLMVKPFQRLCNVQEAVFSCWDPSPVVGPTAIQLEGLPAYLSTWSSSLSAPSPSLVPGPEFESYWRLESLLVKISRHCFDAASRLDKDLKSALVQFSETRHKARVAREEGNLESLRGAFVTMMDAWHMYLNWEAAFQGVVAREIEEMVGVVGGE